MHPERKPNRLPRFDYGAAGAYFITICTLKRQCLLSTIEMEKCKVELTGYGLIADAQIHEIEKRFPMVTVDKYVIMPNHIHMLLSLRVDGQVCPDAGGVTIPAVIQAFKSLTIRLCKVRLFQRSFHDHVIRTDRDYAMIWTYR